MEQELAMLKGGHSKFWGSFNMEWELEVLAILKGEGAQKVFFFLGGGGMKDFTMFQTPDFPIL